MTTKAIIEVEAQTKEALRDVKKFADRTQKEVQSISKGFGALKAVAAGAVAFLAGRQLISGIRTVTDAAAVQEQAVAQLNAALRTSGDFSEEASQSFQDFASELQRTSTVGDETSLQYLALAKSFGASNDQAKELVAAAVDLSAATGVSLDAAVRNLGKSLSGTRGELNELLPATREFTEQQLQSGAAIEAATQQFGGFSEQLLNTFSGATDQASNTFGDFLEIIGSFITENPVVIAGIRSFSGFIEDLGKTLNDNKDAIIGFTVDGLASIADTLPSILTGFQVFLRISGGIAQFFFTVQAVVRDAALGLLDFALSFKSIGTIVNTVKDGFAAFVSTFVEGLSVLSRLAAQIPGVSQQFKDFGIDLKDVEDGLKDFSNTAGTQIGQDVVEPLREGIEKARDANKDFVSGFGEGINAVVGAVGTGAEAVTGLGDKIRALGDAGPQDIQIAADVQARGNLLEGLVKELQQNAGQISRTLFDGIRQGARGAEAALRVGVAGAAEALAPGFGQAAGALFQVLAQGPEKVEELVNSFVQQIPKVLDNVIRAIPVLIETLIQNLDVIIIGALENLITIIEVLIENAPRFIEALVLEIPQIVDRLLNELPRVIERLAERFPDIVPPAIVAFSLGMPKVANALAAQSPRIAVALAKAMPVVAVELAKQAPNIAHELGLAFREEANNIVTIFKEGIQDAFNQAGLDLNVGGGGGGGGNFLENLNPFQTGGVVPQGFPNDTFPARLTSGEGVVNNNDMERLSRFLDAAEGGGLGGGGGAPSGPVVIQLQIGEQQLADVLVNLDRSGFRTEV